MHTDNIGKNIYKYRTLRKMTQAELADRLGYTYQTISNWERGVSAPDVESLACLSEILGVNVDELLGKSQENLVQSKSRSGYSLTKMHSKTTVIEKQELSAGAKIFKYSALVCLLAFALCVLLAIVPIKLFGVIPFLTSVLVFYLSSITASVSFFFSKNTTDKTWLKKIFFIFLSGYIILSIIGIVSILFNANFMENLNGEGSSVDKILPSLKFFSVVNYFSAACYFIAFVLVDFVFVDKSIQDQPKRNLFRTLYYVALIIYLLLSVFGSSFSFVLSVGCMFFIYMYKQDRTRTVFEEVAYSTAKEIEKEQSEKGKEQVPIGLASELMPTTNSGIIKRESVFLVTDKKFLEKQKSKFSIKDLFCGLPLKLYLAFFTAAAFIGIFIAQDIGQVNQVIMIILSLAVCPFIMHFLAFIFKSNVKGVYLSVIYCLLALITFGLGGVNFVSLHYGTKMQVSEVVPAIFIFMLWILSTLFIWSYKDVSDISLILKIFVTAIDLIACGALIITAILFFETINPQCCLIALWLQSVFVFIITFFKSDKFDIYA